MQGSRSSSVQQDFRLSGACASEVTTLWRYTNLFIIIIIIIIMHWSSSYHPLSHRDVILENGRLPDRFQTSSYPTDSSLITKMLLSDVYCLMFVLTQ